jgi:hypothetical protein
MREAGHVARMVKNRNSERLVVGKREGETILMTWIRTGGYY